MESLAARLCPTFSVRHNASSSESLVSLSARVREGVKGGGRKRVEEGEERVGGREGGGEETDVESRGYTERRYAINRKMLKFIFST